MSIIFYLQPVSLVILFEKHENGWNEKKEVERGKGKREESEEGQKVDG